MDKEGVLSTIASADNTEKTYRESEKQVATTFKFDASFVTELKMYAAENQMSMKAVVIEAFNLLKQTK